LTISEWEEELRALRAGQSGDRREMRLQWWEIRKKDPTRFSEEGTYIALFDIDAQRGDRAAAKFLAVPNDAVRRFEQGGVVTINGSVKPSGAMIVSGGESQAWTAEPAIVAAMRMPRFGAARQPFGRSVSPVVLRLVIALALTPLWFAIALVGSGDLGVAAAAALSGAVLVFAVSAVNLAIHRESAN
jgi:hypothetical protein